MTLVLVGVVGPALANDVFYSGPTPNGTGDFSPTNILAAPGVAEDVTVNVNTIEADRLPKMQERAKEKGFNFQYLYDESQKIGRDFGAIYTPEFFVLDKDRKIAYLGAMDDKSPPGQPTLHYLDDAVEATLKGEKAKVGETLARGCLIRYPKNR